MRRAHTKSRTGCRTCKYDPSALNEKTSTYASDTIFTDSISVLLQNPSDPLRRDMALLQALYKHRPSLRWPFSYED